MQRKGGTETETRNEVTGVWGQRTVEKTIGGQKPAREKGEGRIRRRQNTAEGRGKQGKTSAIDKGLVGG